MLKRFTTLILLGIFGHYGTSVAQPTNPFMLEAEADITRITYSLRDTPGIFHTESVSEIGTASDQIWLAQSVRVMDLGDRLEWFAFRPWESGYNPLGGDSFIDTPETGQHSPAFRYPSIWWGCETTDYNGPETLGGVFAAMDIGIRDDYQTFWSGNEITMFREGARFFCYDNVPTFYPGSLIEKEANAFQAQHNFSHVEVRFQQITNQEVDNAVPPDLWGGTYSEPWEYLENISQVDFVDEKPPCGAIPLFDNVEITVYVRPEGGNIDWIIISGHPRFITGSNGPGCSDNEPVFSERAYFEIIRSADFNSDGIENGLDVAQFFVCYTQGLPEADLNLDFIINGLDVSTFLEEYSD